MIAGSVGRGVQVRGPSSGQTGREDGGDCCAEAVEVATPVPTRIRVAMVERRRRERLGTVALGVGRWGWGRWVEWGAVLGNGETLAPGGRLG